MKEERRKEIEAKLHKLIAEIDKDKKTKPIMKSAFSNARVIRRRKGSPDVQIN